MGFYNPPGVQKQLSFAPYLPSNSYLVSYFVMTVDTHVKESELTIKTMMFLIFYFHVDPVLRNALFTVGFFLSACATMAKGLPQILRRLPCVTLLWQPLVGSGEKESSCVSGCSGWLVLSMEIWARWNNEAVVEWHTHSSLSLFPGQIHLVCTVAQRKSWQMSEFVHQPSLKWSNPIGSRPNTTSHYCELISFWEI